MVTQVLPALERVFKMPPTRPPRGSPEWVRYMREHSEEATFMELSQYEAVFKAFLKTEKRKGNRHGQPRVFHGESLDFTTLYKLPAKKDRSNNMLSPTASTPHPHLPFTRRVSHNAAITKLRNAGYWPHAVSAKNCPTGEPYNNFIKVGYKYWIEYCLAEGLTRSSERGRKVLLYIFYAEPMFRGKNSPVMRVIHTCMTSGTHRFDHTHIHIW